MRNSVTKMSKSMGSGKLCTISKKERRHCLSSGNAVAFFLSFSQNKRSQNAQPYDEIMRSKGGLGDHPQQAFGAIWIATSIACWFLFQYLRFFVNEKRLPKSSLGCLLLPFQALRKRNQGIYLLVGQGLYDFC